MHKIIGFTGKARHGKDTCAQIAQEIAREEFGQVWGQYAFALPMKALVYARNPRSLEEVLYHKPPEVRKKLIDMGDLYGRERYGKEYWVRQAELYLHVLTRHMDVDGWVISDIRYPVEFEFCKLGGRVPSDVDWELRGEAAAMLGYTEEVHNAFLEKGEIDEMLEADQFIQSWVSRRWDEVLDNPYGTVLRVKSDRETLTEEFSDTPSETSFDHWSDDSFDGVVYNNKDTTLEELREQIRPFVAAAIS